MLGPPHTFGSGFPFVIVTPLTTTRRGLSLYFEVEATADTGLDAISYIQCELIRFINRNRLVRRLGAVGTDISSRVATVVQTLLDY
jgi:mRNA-degrading endonuclease toxin of MazEF toxin-antitoxin module